MILTFLYLSMAVALGVGLGIGGLCLAIDLYDHATGRRDGITADLGPWARTDDGAFEGFRRIFGPRHRNDDQ